MTETRQLVAILAANPALTSILARPLASEAGLRTLEFETGPALVTFMRISPLELIVVDADDMGSPAVGFVQSLRADRRLASPHFDIIALTRTEPAFHRTLVDAGFDEVLAKPVSTANLLDAVARRLAPSRLHVARDSVFRGLERRAERRPRPALNSARSGDARPTNVIPLFGRERSVRQ